MARMTKAEKQRLADEEYVREQQEAWVSLREAYPSLVFSFVATAQRFNLKFMFTNDEVSFNFVRNNNLTLPAKFPEERDVDFLYVVHTLTEEFDSRQREYDETFLLLEKKRSALAKLTKEEREVLGL